MGSWREVVFLVAADDVDRWSDALLEAGALSVQAEDADADSPDEQPIYGEPGVPAASAGWQRTRLAAMLAEGADPAVLLGAAAHALGLPPPAVPVGDRLLITPSWHLDPGAPATTGDGRLTIVLDPGLAFGTGSHPTTRMCLQWLDAQLHPGQTVIDYGCGSGILAIAAARLGAARVDAVDIDPQAVRATIANAQVNAVRVRARLTTEPGPEPADVVLANILASPLKVLAPMLQSLMRPGGWLVLAGLLDRQAGEVAAAYPAVDLRVFASVDGWSCLAGRKR